VSREIFHVKDRNHKST